MVSDVDIEIAKRWAVAVKDLPKEDVDAAIQSMRDAGDNEIADLYESSLAESSEPKKKSKKSSEPVEG